MSPGQIQVLGLGRDVVDRLRGEDVEDNGLVESGQDGFAVETVHRFKGTEAPVVLVVIAEVATEHDCALAYTGLSRAKSLLEVFGSSDAMRSIGWGAA